MTAFKIPTAEQLARLSDADLMAPITAGDAAVEAVALTIVPSASPVAPPVPALADLLAQAQAVLDCTVSAELPSRVLYAAGISADEPVSYHFRTKGGQMSEDLRKAAGDDIKTVQDIEYAVRVFAAHALHKLQLNRYVELSLRERTAADEVHAAWKNRLQVAAVGELAAISAAGSLSAAEFKFLL